MADLHDARERHHAEDDVAGGKLGQLVRDSRAERRQRLRLGAVPYGDVGAAFRQAFDDRIAHAASADPPDARDRNMCWRNRHRRGQ